MIRGTIVLALATAASAAAAEPVAVIGTGFARSCFDAVAMTPAPRAYAGACDKALADPAITETDRAATLVNRGILRLQARRPADALADFDAAIAVQPGTAAAWVNKGIALMRLGKREAEAVEALSQGIARNPARPEIAYYERGMANEDLGRVREAYEDYSRAAALAPDWHEPAAQLQRFQTVRRKTLQG